MKKIRIALAGNANVGKSVIFNYLTGLHQHIANWPGKTVEKAEGTLVFKNYTIDVIDLPGIYSLSTFSMEELISREYIAVEKPDVVINAIDSGVLERNLFFTIQLLELETPMVIALNQVDLAKKRGIIIDHERLEKLLGIPVVPTVAITGTGIHEALEEALCIVKGNREKPPAIKYGKEIEEGIEKIKLLLSGIKIAYPSRFVSIKLLEEDNKIVNIIEGINPAIVSKAKEYASEIEKIHGEPCSVVIASERYNVANRIAGECQQIVSPEKPALSERLDAITTHRIFGYVIMVAVLSSVFFSIFAFGSYCSALLGDLLDGVKTGIENALGYNMLTELISGGVVEGLIAGITIVMPYIVPFYIILALLEDSGYLTRIAFLMDSPMHYIGLHGKAFIPLMLGYGCNVPACLGCRIMDRHRDRLLAAFVSTLIPCAARTVIILGLVGTFVGMKWALLLYIIDLAIIFALGRIAFRILPGEPVGLIMEMPIYKMPSLGTVLKQTWFRVKDFIYLAFPLIVIGSLALKVLEVSGLLDPVETFLSPITVGWLGLPSIAGVVLIFGILRKELTLVMLASFFGTTNFAAFLTPIQMIVFALVTMLYIPCLATISALAKEFGKKTAFYMAISEIIFAIFIGGIALRLLLLFW